MKLSMSISVAGNEKTYKKEGNELTYLPVEPSAFLKKQLWRIPKGRALDLACGGGRNALFLAQNAYDVDAIDYSAEALEEGRKRALHTGEEINFIEADLKTFPLSAERYDLIIDFNYLERSLATNIVAALKPGGMLLFETFTIDQRSFGSPRNEAYLLERGELKNMFKELDVLYFWEGVVEESEKKKAVARLLSIKRS